MDLEKAREFVRSHHRAVLATRTEDGGIQQSPVLVGVDDEGRLVVSSREAAYKTRNLRRDRWAQLCVLPDSFFGEWAYVEGDAEVVPLPEAMEPLVEYYRGISGEHDDWDEYRRSMAAERRVLIRITARRAGPDRKG
jgi:PPOX class probable F420-dependent enzyme